MESCRVCGSGDIRVVVDLGEQTLSGVFPRSKDQVIPAGPLTVGKCRSCGLAQLTSTYSPTLLYGDNYGYRSGLNATMVDHLHSLAKTMECRVGLQSSDTVLDIGANDGTLLRGYSSIATKKIAIDPTLAKYQDFYAEDATVTPLADFFSAANYWSVADRRAKLVTSVAMFYDLNDPIEFAAGIAEILDDAGLWMLEQSYAPWMTQSGAYDTICHEHLEYYSLTDIDRVVRAVGLTIVDVTTNQVNGGSFNVLVSKNTASHKRSPIVDWMLHRESDGGVNSAISWLAFAAKVEFHIDDFSRLLRTLNEGGASVKGLGASTKGNVILQSCGITSDLIPEIGEVNQEKFGGFTPGTLIPIVPECEVLASKPDYIVVLPWHFRGGFVRQLRDYLGSGGRLIFPLPEIEIVGG